MQSAKCAAPPSRRSSRSTEVITTYAAPCRGWCAARCARLQRIGRLRPAVGDVAERAAARAHLAEDHEGRGALAEALVDVRAGRFLAHRDQAVLAQFRLELRDRVAGRNAHADPARACAAPARRRSSARLRAILSSPSCLVARLDGVDDGERDRILTRSVMPAARRARRRSDVSAGDGSAATAASSPNCGPDSPIRTASTAASDPGPPKSST